jgi:predicted RNase H-like HicB family nuclease
MLEVATFLARCLRLATKHEIVEACVIIAGLRPYKQFVVEEQHSQAGWSKEVRSLMQYLVVIEKGPSSFGAYVPDLPGCVAVGESRAEVTRLIHEAIQFHLEGTKEDGLPIPEPHSYSELVEASV